MPRLLDLFCGAGGAAEGYARAGFEVVGVDIVPQPRYPFEFVRGDALEAIRCLARGDWLFDALHASPPCQDWSRLNSQRADHGTGYLLTETRALLAELVVPWVVENVEGSGLAGQPDLFGAEGLLLCGAMFGRPIYRHRLFGSSFPVPAPPHPRHDVPASRAGHWQPGTVISVAGNCAPIGTARAAMDIGWMRRDELAQAIPPYFTEYIGRHMLQAVMQASVQLP